MSRTSWLVAMLLGCSFVACGGKSEDGGGGTTAEPLCDGSDSVRFYLSSGGGMVEPEYMFTDAYGSMYLVVTGTCQAFVSGDYMQGVRTATLSETEAATLASDVRRSKIASWSGHQDQSCPDAGRVTISDGKDSAWCSCGCDADAPAGLESAIDKANAWRDTLFAKGTAMTGPVAAAARVDTYPMPDVSPLAWPFSWAVGSLPAPTAGKAGKRVEGADAQKLRELREASKSLLDYISVQSAGTQYRVYARDELPDALAAALDAL